MSIKIIRTKAPPLGGFALLCIAACILGFMLAFWVYRLVEGWRCEELGGVYLQSAHKITGVCIRRIEVMPPLSQPPIKPAGTL